MPPPPPPPKPPLHEIYVNCFGPDVDEAQARVYLKQTLGRLIEQGVIVGTEYTPETHGELVIEAAKRAYFLGPRPAHSGPPEAMLNRFRRPEQLPTAAHAGSVQ